MNHPDKAALLAHLAAFINQRPGLSLDDYGGHEDAYRAEAKKVAADARDAKKLLAFVGGVPAITSEELLYALKNAYSGRLSWNGDKLDYCVGQYWPTEYRKAVAAVLAMAVRRYWREHLPMATGLSPKTIYATATKTFGRGIALKWFRP